MGRQRQVGVMLPIAKVPPKTPRSWKRLEVSPRAFRGRCARQSLDFRFVASRL